MLTFFRRRERSPEGCEDMKNILPLQLKGKQGGFG